MASCAEEIHEGDIGTIFTINLTDCDVAVDLTGHTSLQIIFAKPDGTSVTKTASDSGTPTDGIITYTTISGDLDQDGVWRIQAKVTIPAGTFSSDIEKFRVYPNIT